ncbi:MAG TPA: type I-B CRISPR-associated protein Cas5b [Candidatus Competibacteraceae bacterium]|nr:MAG: type I-B CRISPR-associated protein Cas5 [Candidatus Competibacteraceae bacterium]HNW78982.1 type I-B CRISPR-associated protein Cas5b [Candidatus Competibacteraceae bacterium]
MRTLVFEVAGEYGQFKKPYSPMSPVSYPLPPPPAVLGMLGAVLGYGKNEYTQRLNWARLRIAVGLRKPLRVFRAALNLLQTKDGTDAFFRPRAGQNVHTQVPFEFLRQPHFRIYVAGLAEPVADELAACLRNGRSAYTVALGLAPCLADEVRWIGEWSARALPAGEWTVHSAVPLQADISVHYEDNRHYHRLRLPAVMDDARIVHRYQEIVLAEDAQPLRIASGEESCYGVGDDIITFL